MAGQAGAKSPLPEASLLGGLRFLNLSTEGYVCLEDYARAVEVTLAALETMGHIVAPVLHQTDPLYSPTSPQCYKKTLLAELREFYLYGSMCPLC